MHAISSYCGNRPTNKHTHKQTGPTTIHCAAKLSAQRQLIDIVVAVVDDENDDDK